jgi:hypothetical protein
MTESFTCPDCGRTSHHPMDVTNRYCGACHRFHPLSARDELVGFLLSDEYRGLLRRAILSRLATTSNHEAEHIKAVDLFDAAFPERPRNE